MDSNIIKSKNQNTPRPCPIIFQKQKKGWDKPAAVS